MKALSFARKGALDALQLVDLPVPQPAAGEALVAVRAAGINPSDVKNVLGRFPYTTLPRVPGRDYAGVVVQGPAEWIGREVWGTGREPGFVRDGAHAEFIAVPLAGLAAKPAALSFVEAASCGVPFLTALEGLDRSGVAAGTRLLVIGAGGAVGSAAIALARQRCADILAAVRRQEQVDALAAQGIAAILLPADAALAARVTAHWAGGAEVVYDTTGSWLPPAVDALATFGRIVLIAAPADGHVNVPVLNLYRRGGSIVGVNSLLHDMAAAATMLGRLAADFDRGGLRVPFRLEPRPLADGVAAYHAVNDGAAAKIVLVNP